MGKVPISILTIWLIILRHFGDGQVTATKNMLERIAQMKKNIRAESSKTNNDPSWNADTEQENDQSNKWINLTKDDDLPFWKGKKQLRKILLKNYDKQESPREYGNKPLNLSIGVYIISFDYIDEKRMNFKLSMYLRQSWTDLRLRYRPKSGENSSRIHLGIYDDIWVPDLYFRNEKEAHIHHITGPNKLLFLRSDGFAWYVIRISADLFCPMDLRHYPFDIQTCPIYFESFSHTAKSLLLNWFITKPIQTEEQLRVPYFDLVGWHKDTCTQRYLTGVYPCLRVRFKLQREFGTYITQIFLPTAIFVALSWIGFWINPVAVPARCMICMLASVALAVNLTSSKNARVSYVMAVDIWYIICLIYVLVAFMEYALLNVCHSLTLSVKHMKEKQKSEVKQSKPGLINRLSIRRKRVQAPQSPDIDMEENEIDHNLGFAPETVMEDSSISELSQAMAPYSTLSMLVPVPPKSENGIMTFSHPPENPVRVSHWKIRFSRWVTIYIDQISRIVFPMTFIFFVCGYFSFYLNARAKVLSEGH